MRGSRVKKNKEEVVVGSSNVFADLGLADATEKNAKVQLAVAINDILEKKGLTTQAQIAQLLGATQPEVSALSNYKLRIFSLERLVDYLLALDNDVEITIRPKPRNRTAPQTRVINEAA